MSKVLVTGINGFVGRHLARELVSRGCEVVGLGHSGPADKEIEALLGSYHICDLTDNQQVSHLPLRGVNAAINLAGLASVGTSFGNPELYKRVNVSVLTNLANRLQSDNPGVRLIAISTGAVYDSSQRLPLSEKSKLIKASSPYAISKVMMEQEALKLKANGLDMVIARPFNHIGPGQATGFLVPDLYEKLVSAKASGKSVKMGNLEAKRDFTDVRDIAKAYANLALAETLTFDTYNICSGISHSVQEVLNIMIKELNLGDITIEFDQSLVRPDDPKELFGDYGRLHQDTGWMPAIPFEQTIRDFIAWKESG